MDGSNSRQRREFPLHGLVEAVRGRKRTRRLNRRKGRHLASESSLSGRIMLRNEGTEGGCLTSLFSTEHGDLTPRERHEMPFERPYPGQLWQRDSTHVIVVAVHSEHRHL
jgi:hypothetical protein